MTTVQRPFSSASVETTGEPAIALHRFGGISRHWRQLGEAPGTAFLFRAPDTIGTSAAGSRGGAHAFSLADGAAPLLAWIDRHDGPVDLTDHSYGGAVALHVSVRRSNRVSGATLLKPEVQAEVSRYPPKAALVFHALLNEPLLVSTYADLSFPVTIMRGDRSPMPARVIADHLIDRLPTATGRIAAGAGHMGPVTHADAVAVDMAGLVGAIALAA